MHIFIGSDHAGIEYKKHIINFLTSKNFNTTDCGIAEGEKIDYPLISQTVSNNVLDNANSLGILICGTGIGVSIKANRNNGIRAALVYNEFAAEMAKAHNNANVLCFGARTMDLKDILNYLNIFLKTDYEGSLKGGERHENRVKMLDKDLS